MAIYLDDKRLVRKLLRGDERAFDAFFSDNFARLYRFALVRLGDDCDGARDVAQITLSKAVRKLHTYRGESALFTWLCAICRNEVSDWLSARGRYQQHIVLTEDFPQVQAAVESFHAPQDQSPEAQYQRTEAMRLIQVALDRLPVKYGNVLEWKYVEGHSVQEIALRLDVGQEAAQSTIARAKRAFADVYASLLDALNEQSNRAVKA